jgi:glycosyltransferase involved in cell wall biosynthesis
MYVIWGSRLDLRQAFDLSSFEGLHRFRTWFLEGGATREYQIPPEILEATRELASPDQSRQKSVLGSASEPSVAFEEGLLSSRRIAPSSAIGLDVYGYFRAESGLGAAVRANALSALAAKIPVVAHSIPCRGFQNSVDILLPETEEGPSYDCMLLHINADEIGSLPCLYDPRHFRGRHRIGYWVWELANMPAEWSSAYGHVDEIWAPSEFAATAFRQRTAKPVVVIPHAVERPEPPANASEVRKQFGIPTDRFVFLSAFDANSYPSRKNPSAVVAAFANAFPAHPNAPVLVFKIHGARNRKTPEFADFLHSIAETPNVILLDRVLSREDVHRLQWCSDAFISLHRSEGFGLWIAECMVKGKPCIITNYSGNIDFANSQNSVPVSYRMVPIRGDEYPYGAGQAWAEPDMDEAIDALREVYKNASFRATIAREASRAVDTYLSFTAVGQKIRDRLFQARAELIELPPPHIRTPLNLTPRTAQPHLTLL